MSTSSAPKTPAGDGPASERLLVIDGHSMAFRAFYALPADGFMTQSGQYTNAVLGFTNMLVKIVDDESPTHVAVAFDFGKNTFRHLEYAEYKAGRKVTPPEFKGQIDAIKRVLAGLKVPTLTIEGYEADDILATLTARAEAAGAEVLVLSGDRDAFQLASPRTTVLYPSRGVSEMARMTPDAIADKYGVTPANYRGLAALVGEKADNLPGVPKVGEKTAVKWLNAYGDLPGVLDHADDIAGVVGQNLREHVADVERNYRLNELRVDAPVELTFADTARADAYDDSLGEVLDDYELKGLKQRLVGHRAAVRLTGPVPRLEGAALADFFAAAPVAVAADAAWQLGEGDVTTLGLARAGDAGRPDFGVVDLADLSAADTAALAAWLADAARPKVGHAVKPMLHALAARGLPLAGLVDDTAISAYLLEPDASGYDLGRLLETYTAVSIDHDDEPDLLSPGVTLPGLEAAALLALHEALAERLSDADRALLADLELPVLAVLNAMESRGIDVDLDRLGALRDELAAAADAAQQAAFGALGHEVNLGSPKQLQAVLFDELGMTGTKKTKTGYSTDADSLQTLYEQTQHEFLRHLLTYRDRTKLVQTVETLRKFVAADGRIHTTYLQTVAATGRLSSLDPNLQNIPTRTDDGRRIREVFRAPGAGFAELMTADYSQIEMRIMAHLSGDEGLRAAFIEGEDLHNYVGSHVFGVPVDQVTSAMRSKVKAMSYGLAYGLSSFGLAKQLRIGAPEAAALMTDYFERFGGVKSYLDSVVEQAKRDGYTETIFGRRRYLPGLSDPRRPIREAAERVALNSPIQGSAADIMKRAMLGIDRAIAAEGLGSRVLLQVHDEVVVEVADGEREALAELVRREMAGAADLSVPLSVNVGFGATWAAAAH